MGQKVFFENKKALRSSNVSTVGVRFRRLPFGSSEKIGFQFLKLEALGNIFRFNFFDLFFDMRPDG